MDSRKTKNWVPVILFILTGILIRWDNNFSTGLDFGN